jgi:hypothetical protein
VSSALPKGWSKTLDDLFAEKRHVSGEEIEWARTYERNELRSWARFPRGKGLLRKGTRVRISVHTSDPEPIGVYADPLEKALVEAALVPEADRIDAKYAGFSLFIKTAELNKLFRIVSTGDNAA